MFIDLTKRLKLKKFSQLFEVNRRISEKRKNILNQFVEVFDNQLAETFDNQLKKIYIDIAFEINNKFIYYVNERRRLCIFAAYEQKIFRITHDEN